MLSFLKTPNDIMKELSKKFKERRLTIGYTQQALADRSGVSLGSLKRFESTGQISLESLLQLALVLECLDDFGKIANPVEVKHTSMEELLKEKKIIPKRGHKK
ncbi:MAG: Transcriptional regulator [uncultured Sulfurovum sp.]|uniref:Transcriptional regulator n=1 Tax=uncultured Sulfurovum sp. TaxID=269237 RepID=A0A6S6S018_9BACT|nr:MAG: Transcriptional regulator [uncultured Sulfurovum sp.]